MSKKVAIVVAHSFRTRAIGKNGDLPWMSLKKDLHFFRTLTSTTIDPHKTNAVVMGRKTWESIPPKFRPLSNRFNVVLSRSLVLEQEANPSVLYVTDLNKAVQDLQNNASIESIFIVGGGDIYLKALALNLVDEVFATVVHAEFENCDTFFPELSSSEFELVSSRREEEEGGGSITAIAVDFQRFCRTTKKRSKVSEEHEEYQYLNLVREILTKGEVKRDRTGTGTKSVFGRTMRFSLRNNVLPLLTTKRTFWRGVAVELLWFISGKTDNKTLKDQGVNIWDGNSSRKYLDSIGLVDREEGDLGPIYGFQWRHFGAEYSTMHEDYTGKGVDQLVELIAMIKRDPDSRRLILSSWNPVCLKQMALPPCHVLCQFYVSAESRELSCQLYQRSADMGLGVPFNIASYALLTRLIAHCCGLQCGELIHVIGDCHVYLNHVDALNEQLKHEPTPFPVLKINTSTVDIEKITLNDLELIGYNPHKSIKMDMAV